MTTDCLHQPAVFRHLDDYSFGSPTLRRAHAALDVVGIWLSRRRRRRTLTEIAGLGEHIMLDLGFDPDELRLEITKPFWRR